MDLPLFWIDAFAARPFTGNPAAVVLLAQWLPDEHMQLIAFENGLAETAFLVRTGADRYQLRWFTPAVEVDLCGHATLAAGHVVLRVTADVGGDCVTFDSRSGPLTVTRRLDDKLELDFPATPATDEHDAATLRCVTTALGRQPSWLGRTRFDLFAVIDRPEELRTLRPDLAAVAAAGGRGLIVTAPGDGDADFVSRFFAPQSGINEDPATGSAHCALAPYWSTRLRQERLHARQLSPRGAELWCEVVGDRIRIAGNAVLYLSGRLHV